MSRSAHHGKSQAAHFQLRAQPAGPAQRYRQAKEHHRRRHIDQDIRTARALPHHVRERWRRKTAHHRTRKIRKSGEHIYLGAFEQGIFKTFRADHVIAVEQLSTGHTPSIVAWPQYSTVLPHFPVENAVYKVPTFSLCSSRSWTVDLGKYTCTCPEKRVRIARGYQPGQLGFCCAHIARILKHLPPNASAEWTAELKDLLADGRKMHIDNLPASC